MKTIFIPWRTVRIIWCAVLTLIFQLVTYYAVHAQGRVGIGTAHPQAKLHVAGNLLIDTVRETSLAQYVLTRDTDGVVAAIAIDSLKATMGLVNSTQQFFSQEISAQTSTTSSVAQSRVTLSLLPGTYMVMAYAEVFNAGSVAGARMWLFEGSAEIAYGAPYSNTTTYGGWSALRIITTAGAVTITLSYSSWPAGTTTYIRRARIVALKIA